MLTAAALMLVGVSALGSGRARRAGAVGLVVLGVGISAARVVAAAPVPSFVLAVNAGLVILGIAVCGVALVQGGREERGVAVIGPLAGAAGAILAAVKAVPAVADAGAVRVLVVVLGLGALGGAWIWTGRRTRAGDAIRRREPDLGSCPGAPAVALPLLALGALAAAFAGHIAAVLAGAVASSWGAWLFFGRARRRPYAPVLVTLLLGGALWLLATIAGPEGLALSAIPWLPLSPAAERLVALLLAAAAWGLSGLWPLRQPAGGALTAPVGTWVLLRLGIPAVPAGLEHWRPGVFPLVVTGMWYAAITRRVTALAIGGALLGVASLDDAGLAGAGWLLACAVALELRRRWEGREQSGADPLLRVGIALAAGWGGLSVVEAGLRSEVVYTILAAAAAAVGLGGRPALTPPPAGSIFGPETG